MLKSTTAMLGVAGIFAVSALYTTTVDSRPYKRLPNMMQVHGCTVSDGDTIRCGEERIRLLGYDSAELAGHCRRGRVCAPGDGVAQRQMLVDFIGNNVTRVRRYGHDRYGRTLGDLVINNVSATCYMVSHGGGIPKPTWDKGGTLKRCKLKRCKL